MGKNRNVIGYEAAVAILPNRLRKLALALPEEQKAAAEELRLRAGRPMTVLLPEGEVQLDAVVDPISLFEPVYADGGDTVCVMDKVRDNKNTDEAWLERIALKDALKLLDDRERRILSLRFYEGKTQMEVSSEIGISQAQVSRLEKGAINTIKKHI